VSAPVARAKIYDLGYKRYEGTRRPQSTRWQAITRDLLRHGWKKWWRWKLFIGLSVVITAGLGAFLVFTKSDALGDFSSSGVVIKAVDQIVFLSFRWYMQVCFFLSLPMGAWVVSTDLRSGAFTFYFARPVRPGDYILGKLVALWLVQASVILVPLLIIAGIRIGLSSSQQEIIDNLGYLPKALLMGTAAALLYSSISLMFSSMFDKPWLNVLAWVGYYLLLSTILTAVALNVVKVPALGGLDPGFVIQALAVNLYDIELPGKQGEVDMPDLVTTLLSMGALVLVSITVSYLRIRGGYRGIGGAS
jgi:ABC-type transport system involved in multi-copper enzyme maturation permease subunit